MFAWPFHPLGFGYIYRHAISYVVLSLPIHHLCVDCYGSASFLEGPDDLSVAATG